MCQVWCSGIQGIYACLLRGCQSSMDICALCCIWNLFGVMVFQRSLLAWWWGGVNLPWVYVYCAIYELVWYNGFPDIYAWLEERGWGQSVISICALCYIYLPVDLPSLVLWYSRHLCLSQRGQSTIDPCYTITPSPCHLIIDPSTPLHLLLPIDHRSMLHHYTPYICPRYLCIVLYVKLMWCSGLPWIYCQLEEGWGQSVMKLIWCSGLTWIYGQLGVGLGSVCHENYLV